MHYKIKEHEGMMEEDTVVFIRKRLSIETYQRAVDLANSTPSNRAGHPAELYAPVLSRSSGKCQKWTAARGCSDEHGQTLVDRWKANGNKLLYETQKSLVQYQ